MATPKFWYYPDPDGTVEEIDLLTGLTGLNEQPSEELAVARIGDGSPSSVHVGSSFRVRIALERFGTAGANALERACATLGNHLARGGWVAFARNPAKAWAGRCTSVVSRGDSVVRAVSAFTAWSPLAAVAADDEIVLELPYPDAQREQRVVTGVSGIAVTMERGAVFTYSARPIVRHRDFWPALSLPEEGARGPIITHDGRRTYTLSVTLEYSPADVLAMLSPSGDSPSAALPLRGASGAGASIERLARSGALRGSALGVPRRMS